MTAVPDADRRTAPAVLGRGAKAVLVAVAAMLGSTARGMAQPNQVRIAEANAPLLLEDLYSQVQPGASRPPDPQFQLGSMNFALPRLALMPVLGMNQLKLMQMLPLGGLRCCALRFSPKMRASAAPPSARSKPGCPE